MDVILHTGNETSMIEAAKCLGHKELIVLSTQIHKKPSLETLPKGLHAAAWIQEPSDVGRAKGYEFVFAPAERAFFESRGVTHMVEDGQDPGKDQLYQRRADVDEVMASLAKERGKTVVLDLRHADDPYILGRLMQTARVCRKYKVKTMTCTFASDPLQLRSERDLQAFERLIG